MKPRVRRANDRDLELVRYRWSRDAYRLGRDVPGLYTLFWPLFEGVMARILKRASVLVAVNSEEDDQVFASIVYEGGHSPVLHHVMVKPDFRKRGLAKILLQEAGFRSNKPAVYSLRPVPHKLAPKQWTYVPFGLMP